MGKREGGKKRGRKGGAGSGAFKEAKEAEEGSLHLCFQHCVRELSPHDLYKKKIQTYSKPAMAVQTPLAQYSTECVRVRVCMCVCVCV
uniref:Uncharacterized protein n=1 Tax=Anguilla anguilla TaxID=7936 RepID=A0A0E9QIS7_ANGAN